MTRSLWDDAHLHRIAKGWFYFDLTRGTHLFQDQSLDQNFHQNKVHSGDRLLRIGHNCTLAVLNWDMGLANQNVRIVPGQGDVRANNE